MRHTYSDLHIGRNRINKITRLLRLGQIVTINTPTFDDRGRQTMVKADYTLVGIYPHHAVFTRTLPNGRTLSYSFTKAELANFVFDDTPDLIGGGA